jgi:ATP-dependent DNA helicase RecQ
MEAVNLTVQEDRTLALLNSHFGYDSFRPWQEEIVANVLSRRDTLVLMPTGGGKSLCYQLPALCFDGLTLVVSPLIALMKDQVDVLRANGIAAEFINSTLDPEEINRVQRRARQGQLKILYLAPERLAQSRFRSFLHTLQVSLIAIDEAHCISEWGHDFRPDYRHLDALRKEFPEVPVIALTATATNRVREDIVTQLELREPRIFLASFNRANLNYLVQPKKDAFAGLQAHLRRHENQATIIYCISRRETEVLSADLNAQGLKALPYHAGLDNSLRIRTQEQFIRDEVPIIVATIAFGMGIDKPDIRLVVHYALPRSLEGYYQETGRAGRDGLPSDCVLLYSYGDKVKQEFFINQIGDQRERQNAGQKLDQVVEFCQLQTCRRRYLMEYFGERWEAERCDGCDPCLTPVEEFEATEISQKILSAVIRSGERFGINHVIGVLRGVKTRRVLESRHDRLGVYGIARDFTEDELKQIVGQLLARGLLLKSGGEYPTLSVSPAGRTFLQRREELTLVRPRQSAEVMPISDGSKLNYDQSLFEQLRSWRKRMADDRNVPPYVIFSDVSLREMSYYLPQTPDSFARIHGVGKAKLQEYSQGFLAVIRRHAESRGLMERPIPARPGISGGRRDGNAAPPRQGSTYEETRELVWQGFSIPEIAHRRGLAEDTVLNHLERLVLAGASLELDHLLPAPDRLARIEGAFQESGSRLLAPVRELLGPEYSYREIRLVSLYRRQREGQPIGHRPRRRDEVH